MQTTSITTNQKIENVHFSKSNEALQGKNQPLADLFIIMGISKSFLNSIAIIPYNFSTFLFTF